MKGDDVGLIPGYTKDKITVTFTGTQTDAGSSDNTATASIDDNFIVVVHPGTLTVNPRKIYVTLYECQSAYNGKYIEKDDIIYDVTCALDGVTVDIEQIRLLNVSDEFTGAEQLDCKVYLNSNLIDSKNYMLIASVDEGAVVCRTKAEITVKSSEFTTNYEKGKIYSDPTLHVFNLLEGYTLKLRDGATTTSIEGDPYKKVEVKNVFSTDDIVICDANGEDVTDNFKINPKYGKITIMPKQS